MTGGLMRLLALVVALVVALVFAGCVNTFRRGDGRVPEESSFERVGEDAEGGVPSPEGDAGAEASSEGGDGGPEETWTEDESVDFDDSDGGFEEVE